MDRSGFNDSIASRPDVPLEQRKAEFLDATRRIDPLAALRRHPWNTVGTALMMGMAVGAPHVVTKVKAAKSSLVGRLLKAAGLRVVQHFVAARAAKAQAAALAAASPQSGQASA